MLRYKLLLQRELEASPCSAVQKSLRDLARELSMPVPSLHNYVSYDVLPRIDNIQKMANLFDESISSLYSEDNDLTARLVARIRKLSADQKQKLLEELR